MRWRRRQRRLRLTLAVMAVVAILSLLPQGRLPVRLPFRWAPGGADEPTIAVWHASAGRVDYLPLEQYVQGVVAAEMPSHFHVEALKAQAVAARTYALRRIEEDARLPQRPEAHVSSDYQVHQAWTSRDEFVNRWGPVEGLLRWRRVSEAVAATRGLVLMYDGRLIDALYHASSGGHTEDAARYFQSSVPYLVGVPDVYSEEAPGNESVASFHLSTVFERLGLGDWMATAPAAVGDVSAGSLGGQDLPVAVVSRTEAGRAAEVVVGGRLFTGRQVREALGLRSNWFDVTVDGDVVVFHVRGYGHGVGMSQYGADGMARAGYTFDEILAHYYRGAALEQRY